MSKGIWIDDFLFSILYYEVRRCVHFLDMDSVLSG